MLSRTSLLLWFAGVALCLAYAAGTPPATRSYDTKGHIRYVKIVADTGTLPDARDCWVCYHPPLYPALAAVALRAVEPAPSAVGKTLQFFSVFLFGIVMFYLLRLAELVLKEPRSRVMAFALAMAVPSSLFNSARIGNDALVYALWAAALFHVVRWETDLRRRDLLLAAALIALGFLTKLSIAPAAAALLAAVATTWRRSPAAGRTAVARQGLAALAVMAAGVAGYVLWSRSFLAEGVTANADQLNDVLSVTTTWWRQFLFEPVGFLFRFAEPYNDAGGRQFFFNFWMKSLLVAEFTHRQPGAAAFMTVTAAASLAVVAMFIAMAPDAFRRREPAAPLWTVILAPLFSLAYYWAERFSSSADARYVYPVVLAGAVALARMIEAERESGDARVAAWATLVVVAFCVAGFSFQAAVFRRL